MVLLGVMALVFVMFQGFGDPTRLITGQSGDKKTMDNIRKDLYLDQPKWKQFLLYVNDVSPLAFHSTEDIKKKGLKGFFIGNEKKFVLKLPYLGKSYQSKKKYFRCTFRSASRNACAHPHGYAVCMHRRNFSWCYCGR